MNSTETRIRTAFSDEAETITMAPQLRAGINERARRYRARRAATVGTSALAVLALAIAIPVARRAGNDAVRPAAAPAARAGYESWAPRGDLADDDVFIRTAVNAWAAEENAGGPPHTDVRVLYAGRFDTGRAAVLLGTDPVGARRLAVVAGAGRQLFPIRDVPAPVTLTHLSFNVFTDDESKSPASYRDTLVVVLPPDGTHQVRWESLNALHFPAPDGIAVIDISASGPKGRPTIQVLGPGGGVVYDGPIGSMS